MDAPTLRRIPNFEDRSGPPEPDACPSSGDEHTIGIDEVWGTGRRVVVCTECGASPVRDIDGDIIGWRNRL